MARAYLNWVRLDGDFATVGGVLSGTDEDDDMVLDLAGFDIRVVCIDWLVPLTNHNIEQRKWRRGRGRPGRPQWRRKMSQRSEREATNDATLPPL